MIDIEADIYDAVYTAIEDELGEGKFEMSSDAMKIPETFPYIYFEQVDSYTDESKGDSSQIENFAILTYSAQVYSNDESLKKSICKKITAIIDSTLRGLNFNQISCTASSGGRDNTIYRIGSRYRVRARRDGTLYYRRRW